MIKHYFSWRDCHARNITTRLEVRIAQSVRDAAHHGRCDRDAIATRNGRERIRNRRNEATASRKAATDNRDHRRTSYTGGGRFRNRIVFQYALHLPRAEGKLCRDARKSVRPSGSPGDCHRTRIDTGGNGLVADAHGGNQVFAPGSIRPRSRSIDAFDRLAFVPSPLDRGRIRRAGYNHSEPPRGTPRPLSDS